MPERQLALTGRPEIIFSGRSDKAAEMGYWQEEWQRANERFHSRSLSVILLRIFLGVAFIAGIFWGCALVYERYQFPLYLISGVEIGMAVAVIRDMVKEGGSVHDLAVYFGNHVLKKKVVTYHTEIKILQSRIGELEAKNLELLNDKQSMQERLDAIVNKDKNEESTRGVASYQKLLIFYMQKYRVDYSDSSWAGKTAKAMELQGLSITDRTLRTIRNGLLEFEEERKNKP